MQIYTLGGGPINTSRFDISIFHTALSVPEQYDVVKDSILAEHFARQRKKNLAQIFF